MTRIIASAGCMVRVLVCVAAAVVASQFWSLNSLLLLLPILIAKPYVH